MTTLPPLDPALRALLDAAVDPTPPPAAATAALRARLGAQYENAPTAAVWQM